MFNHVESLGSGMYRTVHRHTRSGNAFAVETGVFPSDPFSPKRQAAAPRLASRLPAADDRAAFATGKTPTMNVLRGNNGPRYRHVADNAAPYETIAVDKLTPIIGAEIGGVDLSAPLPNHQMDEIHRALAEN